LVLPVRLGEDYDASKLGYEGQKAQSKLSPRRIVVGVKHSPPRKSDAS